jgi:hypothetical protein
MDNNDWSWWRNALAGNRGELTRGDPKSGFFRDRKRACAIWRDEAGELCASVSSGYEPRHADEIDEAFGFWSMNPVSHEVYSAFMETGKWPEDTDTPAPSERGIGDNMAGMTPAEALKAELTDLQERAKAWFTSIGNTIKTQVEADRAANYASEFGALEAKGKDGHRVEKEPHLKKGREVDAAWKPTTEAAETAKKWMKRASEAFLIAEQSRLREVARARAEGERKAAAEAAARHEPPPAPSAPPEPVRAKAGTTRAVSLRTRKIYQIDDIPAAAGFLANMKTPPDEFRQVVERIIRKLRSDGVEVPGVRDELEEYAA